MHLSHREERRVEFILLFSFWLGNSEGDFFSSILCLNGGRKIADFLEGRSYTIGSTIHKDNGPGLSGGRLESYSCHRREFKNYRHRLRIKICSRVKSFRVDVCHGRVRHRGRRCTSHAPYPGSRGDSHPRAGNHVRVHKFAGDKSGSICTHHSDDKIRHFGYESTSEGLSLTPLYRLHSGEESVDTRHQLKVLADSGRLAYTTSIENRMRQSHYMSWHYTFIH